MCLQIENSKQTKIQIKGKQKKIYETFGIENGLGIMDITISWKIALVAIVLLAVILAAGIILLSIYAVRQRRNRKRTEKW